MVDYGEQYRDAMYEAHTSLKHCEDCNIKTWDSECPFCGESLCEHDWALCHPKDINQDKYLYCTKCGVKDYKNLDRERKL